MILKNLNKTLTFKRGIHPPYNKDLACAKPIETCPLPKTVIIPLQQHIGAPAKPIIEKGEEIRAGQLIGEAENFICSPIHSSVNGIVKAIKPSLHTNGFQVIAAEIEVNKEDNTIEKLKPLADNPTAKDIIKRVKEAGLTGMGGAAFPTHVKLSPPKDKTIETVIINGCECEPYITCDHRLMLEKPNQLIEGLKLIIKTVDAKRGLIAVETNKPNAIKLLKEKVSSIKNIDIVMVKTKYPQGSEKQLIEAITKKQVPTGGLPADIGILVQNVGTAIAIEEAVNKGKPLIERVVTISGEGINKPKNLLVRLGTPISHLIDVCSGLAEEGVRVIAGGPMTGIIQTSLEAPIVKGTSAITVLKQDKFKETKPEPCIKCARCVGACPIGLLPLRIKAFAEKGLLDDLEMLSVYDCIECGACSYVCPARIPLVHWIKYAKTKLKEVK